MTRVVLRKTEAPTKLCTGCWYYRRDILNCAGGCIPHYNDGKPMIWINVAKEKQHRPINNGGTV